MDIFECRITLYVKVYFLYKLWSIEKYILQFVNEEKFFLFLFINRGIDWIEIKTKRKYFYWTLGTEKKTILLNLNLF